MKFFLLLLLSIHQIINQKTNIMTTTSETGHAKNVANFYELILYSTAYGTSYNPSKAFTKLTVLQTLSLNANNAFGTVNEFSSTYGNAIAARETAFLPLSKLATRLINVLKTIDAISQTIDNAEAIDRKI